MRSHFSFDNEGEVASEGDVVGEVTDNEHGVKGSSLRLSHSFCFECLRVFSVISVEREYGCIAWGMIKRLFLVFFDFFASESLSLLL